MVLNVTLSFPASAASAGASPVVAERLTVRRCTLSEPISQLFHMTVEVLSPDPAIDERAVVGQPVAVALADEPFVKEVRGIVRRMVQRTSVPSGESLYAWAIVPPLWLTTRRRDRRIFQNLSVPEIVKAVLADPTYGGRIPPPRELLGGATFAAREYVVQHDETDHAFLTRILGDEGIASFFDHTNGSAWTLIADTSTSAPSLTGPIPFSDPTHPNPLVGDAQIPHVQTAVITTSVETSAVTIRDYDFERPDIVLEAKKAIDAGAAFANEFPLEAYTFEVGKFTEQAPGDARAEAMLDTDRNDRRRILCTATFALPPGTRLPLVDHPRADLAGEFLVMSAHMTVDASGTTRHDLELVDLRERFRPGRLPKPRIHGTQTAFVVGAEGEEIDVDAYGRVEVEFRWDRRTGGTSRRVRVAQAWAGAGFGLVMLPRVNDEVIVAYLDGDPYQPIIVGRVHNALATPPLKLPAEKTLSVWRSKSSPRSDGFNQILMDDQAGAERLELHAQRDFRLETGHDAVTTVGNDQTVHVGGNQTLTVDGDRKVLTVGGLAITSQRIRLTAGRSTIDLSDGEVVITSPVIRLDQGAQAIDLSSPCGSPAGD
jgi:type VI secretion system secreted protein VgrG